MQLKNIVLDVILQASVITNDAISIFGGLLISVSVCYPWMSDFSLEKEKTDYLAANRCLLREQQEERR
jgi:hypothetical protein